WLRQLLLGDVMVSGWSATSTASPATAKPATVPPAADAHAYADPWTVPVEDEGRLIDRRRDLVDRRGIDGRPAWVALSVASQIVSWRANRRCLRIGRR